jgi:hypothetical protein
MPEGAARSDPVSHQPFDLPDFGEAAAVFPRPDHFIADADLKHSPCSIRGENHGADLRRKRREKLLRHPAGTQTPAAESAVSDLDHGAGGHNYLGTPVS